MKGIPKPCKRTAKRRPHYEPRGKCNCAVCGEYEQLNDVAEFHDQQGARNVAMNFLAIMEEIRLGRRPPYDLSVCFD